MKKNGILLVLVLVLVSCKISKNDRADVTRYTVASEMVDCMGEGPQRCLQVKKEGDTNWTLFYSNIKGFEHESGYESVIEVKRERRDNIPQGASAFTYTMLKQISKTKKTSEDMIQSVPIAGKYIWTGTVVGIKNTDIGRGAAKNRFSAVVLTIEVTSKKPEYTEFNVGDTIHCEMIPGLKIKPEIGKEYAFKAKDKHPAHALGVYLLETDVIELVKEKY